MAFVSGTIVTGAQAIFTGFIQELVFEIKDTEGITEQDAKDVVANLLVDLAINTAAIMVVLKTGAGVKAAEWLGLTSRNYGKAALSKAAQTAAGKLAADGGKSMARRMLPKLVKLVPGPVGLLCPLS